MHSLSFTPAERLTITDTAVRIANRIMAGDFLPVSYTNDLALESLLRAGLVMGRPRWVARVAGVVRRRPPLHWSKEPFVSLTYAWAEYTQDEEVRAHFIEQSYALRRELVPRSYDGLVQHPRGEIRGGGMGVLIDSFQEYVSRLCRAAAWAEDQTLADDAAEQVALHEKLLLFESTGLWRQGRGWLDDRVSLSPGTWSRGQGWLMRGFSDALVAMPPGEAARSTISGAFQRLAAALLPRQDSAGAWHALPHLSFEDSGPESSGTALIAAAMIKGLRLRVLTGEKMAEAARRAVLYVAGCVDTDGVVHNTCYGPGPLADLEPWRKQTFPPGDHHGPGTVLAALTAALD